jgi:hypothetical protein
MILVLAAVAIPTDVSTTTLLTAMGLLSTINTFYDAAWLKLMGVIGLVGLIVGVIVPLIIASFQNKNNNELREALRKEIVDEAAKLAANVKADTTRLDATIQQETLTLKKNIASLEIKLAKDNNKAMGGVFFVQGDSWVEVYPMSALISFLRAAEHMALGDDEYNLELAMGRIVSILNKNKDFSELELLVSAYLDTKKALSDPKYRHYRTMLEPLDKITKVPKAQ